MNAENLPNFEWGDEPFGEIPGSADELLAEWEKADEVKAAKATIAEQEKLAAEKHAEMQRLNQEAADLEKQIRMLETQRSSISSKAFGLRNSIPTNERMIERAKAVVRIAQENYEREQHAKEELARVEIDVTQFLYGQGLPDGRKIMAHQIEAAKIIALNNKVILGDDMGVGKTLSMIAAMDFCRANRVLVVAPADVTSNFLREIRTWAPHRFVVNIKGKSKVERNTMLDMAQMLDNVVVVVNYEAWRRDFNLLQKFEELQFDMLLMDEAHVMKRTTSNAQEGMDRIATAKNTCSNCGLYVEGSNGKCLNSCGAEIVNSIKHIVPATGTPILNSPEDIFPLLRFVDPRNFYNLYGFLDSFAERDPYTNKYKFRPGGEEMLMKRMGYRFLRRTMQDVGIELPRQQIIQHDLELEDSEYELQLAVYKELKEYSEVMLGGEDEYGNPRKISTTAMIALITRLRQATVWPAGITINVKDEVTGEITETLSLGERVNESIKIDKAVELIEEAWLSGKRVAVFSQFKTGLAELQRRLDQTPIRSVRFDGDTTQSVRDEVKVNFNRAEKQESKWDAVLCNYKTGGVGLNLTECTHMILLDMEWNPGKEEQALKRIARIGQTEETFVHVLNVVPSIDTWMRGLIETKREMISGFEVEQESFQNQFLRSLRAGDL